MNASVSTRPWRDALLFDLALAALVGVYLAGFLSAGNTGDPITPDILRIRAFGSCALILWTGFLLAEPLARLDPRFVAPAAHAGHIAAAALGAALVHAVLTLNWYHDIGALDPLVALLADNVRFASLTGFPYELLGVAALLLILAGAAGGAAFRRRSLPGHRCHAVAALPLIGYGLAVMHVALGALQSERSPVWVGLLAASFVAVIATHLAASGNRAPERWRGGLRLTRWFGLGLAGALCLSAGLSLILARTQRDPGAGGWGDGEVYVSGVLEAAPYPLIHAAERSDGRRAGPVILVAEGKFGAPAATRHFNGQPVEARGYALNRGGVTVLQLVEETDAMRALAGDPRRPPIMPVPLGHHVLRGEIVDSKCFIGAMKPGDGKAHKDCGALCVFGGIPPMLLTRDAAGTETLFLLADAQGGSAREAVFPYIGEPVELTADIERRGELNLARIEANSLHPLAR